MYSIGHHTFKLDGVITEFADIYAPLAQIWKNSDAQELTKKQRHREIHLTSAEN